MQKRIYHGSENRIERPIYGYGKKYNDYGVGFYCTESIEMVKEWGVGAGCNVYANIYDLNMDGLTVLNLSDHEYCILHWLSVLLQNREFEISSALTREANMILLCIERCFFLLRWQGSLNAEKRLCLPEDPAWSLHSW